MLRFCVTALIIGFGLPPAIHAAEPSIRTLDVRGLRVGGAATLVIDGDDLGKVPRLLLPFAAKQTLKTGSTDKKATFDVTLADDVTPGYHQLRVVTDGGVSLPVVIGVDRLPQQNIAFPVAELPVALHGAVAGGATVEVKFQGKAKQKVMIEIEAQRLGSKLRPVVHLVTPKKLQLAWAWASPTLYGDARLEAVLPDDGVYTVTLHDVEYAAAAPSFFRLKIGEWSYVDQVFPPAIDKRKMSDVEFIGSPGKLSVLMDRTRAKGAYGLWPKSGPLWSGPQPFITVSPHPEFVKEAAKDKLQELPEGRVGVSGKLLAPFDEHRYRVAVSPGKKIKLEVFAERIGSPIDVALVVRNDKGDQLARAEDSPGTLDPILEYAVPDKVTSIILGVVDAQGRGGPHGIYRLVVDPQTPSANDGFKLTTLAQKISLPLGARIVLPIFVERRGYLGKIDLSANLPPGIKLDGGVIPDGADGTLVTLERSGAFDAGITKWQGRGGDGVEQIVAIKGHSQERLQPWLATEIAIASSDAKPGELVVDWRGLPADVGLVPGGKLALPIKTTRTNEKTTVKLTLLTSQATPILNNAPDPLKALRQEKPIELPVKVSDGEVVVLVPIELSSPMYDVTIQAELLDAAKKVLATAYMPVRRMEVRMPLIVKLDGATRIEAMMDAKKGATLTLKGKVERREGAKGDVALALTGLPAGAKADAVTLKADASDFVINVTFPPTFAVGEIKGIKLAGSFAPEPKTPNVRVRSREVELTLVIQAAGK